MADGGWPSLTIAWATIKALDQLLGHHPRADSRAWLRNIWASRVVACQTEQGDVNGEAS